jgi:hypothetical protein
MTFEDLLTKHATLVNDVIETSDDRFRSPDDTESWKALRKALEADLSDLPADKVVAAGRAAAVELVSMVLYPDGGGAGFEGQLGGGTDNPDTDDQLAMEMPDSTSLDIMVPAQEA